MVSNDSEISSFFISNLISRGGKLLSLLLFLLSVNTSLQIFFVTRRVFLIGFSSVVVNIVFFF